MTTQTQPKQQTTKGGALDIHDEEVVRVGSEAELKGAKQPLDHQPGAGGGEKPDTDR